MALQHIASHNALGKETGGRLIRAQDSRNASPDRTKWWFGISKVSMDARDHQFSRNTYCDQTDPESAEIHGYMSMTNQRTELGNTMKIYTGHVSEKITIEVIQNIALRTIMGAYYLTNNLNLHRSTGTISLQEEAPRLTNLFAHNMSLSNSTPTRQLPPRLNK